MCSMASDTRATGSRTRTCRTQTPSPGIPKGNRARHRGPAQAEAGWRKHRSAPPEEPQRTYLDLDDDVANRYVRGQSRRPGRRGSTPGGTSGYSRTADYTRKTQELAQQRQQAEYALAVSEHCVPSPPKPFGSSPNSTEWSSVSRRRRSRRRGYEDPDDNPYLDPTERRLAQVERQNQRSATAVGAASGQRAPAGHDRQHPAAVPAESERSFERSCRRHSNRAWAQSPSR